MAAEECKQGIVTETLAAKQQERLRSRDLGWAQQRTRSQYESVLVKYSQSSCRKQWAMVGCSYGGGTTGSWPAIEAATAPPPSPTNKTV